MSRTSGSIELVGFPNTTPLAVTQPPSVHTKDDRTQSLAEDGQPIISKTDVPGHEQIQPPNKRTTATTLVTIVCVTMISSMLSGVVTIALPTMARELNLAPSVLLWY